MNKNNSSSICNSVSDNTYDFLVGENIKIKAVNEQMRLVACTNSNVLITGESGTGKELIARGIHLLSNNRDFSFVPVNCGAIPHELLESELFGHLKGAFTGAITSRKGRFELAENGTLFLDEIGDMTLHMQVKLLRILQERKYEPVGSEKTLTTNARIIAATHRDLETQITNNLFREDLFYRLNVFPIHMPALRERKSDIPLLINTFSSRISTEKDIKLGFSEDAILSLMEYSWPGNVRELENLIERMSILYPDKIISVHHLPKKYQSIGVAKDTSQSVNFNSLEEESGEELPENGLDLKFHLENIERSLISQALSQAHGVVAHAAKLLGLRRTTLVEKLKKYGAICSEISQKIDMVDSTAQ